MCWRRHAARMVGSFTTSLAVDQEPARRRISGARLQRPHRAVCVSRLNAGIEERFAQNARRHFGRKIGYGRRSQFCSGLAERKGFKLSVRLPLPNASPITIESLRRAQPRRFSLRLSSCRFHDASTNEISDRNPGSNKPSKTMRFQGLVVWLRG